ncbi:MAG: class I SAM-dependent methyltransferase [Chloroflexi bacterium]|nr:class I SAM-dependent methyltransferase [Chloroflexota bacterium]MCI0649757.1 class I SAM-dependent methyltransferase [Chloroflexota bacterium]MCI0725496.1 class I SAM-dependent methyltransferase [Chloroflexota bacterium]
MTAFDDIRYVREQYKSQDNLQIRILTHEKYTQPRVDFVRWVLAHLVWRGDETVVDVGCGSGAYVAETRPRCRRYIAADLSLGMLRGLPYPGLDRLNGDVQRLPLASASAGVVLANHMLYHVPDKEAAVAEIARILRPGGRLLAATNSAHTMAELRQLQAAVGVTLGLAEAQHAFQNSQVLSPSFTLENGHSLLERHFEGVERADLHTALVFPEPQPVLDYVSTIRERFEPFLQAGHTWENVIVALRRKLEQIIAQEGKFRVNKLAGVFICTKGD